VPIKPCWKGTWATVYYVLLELYAVAGGMAREDPELDVIEHALRWSRIVCEHGGDMGGCKYADGTSEMHERFYWFVRGIFA
jgi:hypothetical protein